MFSAGVSREFARTGATGATGATLDIDREQLRHADYLLGKGFGDLPIGFLRPFAITGTLAYTIPDKKLKVTGVRSRTGRAIVQQWHVEPVGPVASRYNTACVTCNRR